jgi:fumarate reductase flavoprotein subunit
VNQSGQRFTDESAAALPLATAVRAQPGKLAYLLFDERIASKVVAHDPFFARVVLPKTSRRGSTPKHLAKQLSLPEDGITRTIETYHAGADPFGRSGTRTQLVEPFYGVRVTGARRHTRGGLAIDADARVLGTAGTPVPGLFAVGGAAAGVARPGTDSGCAGLDALAALTSARLAALALGQVADEG